jgi:DNA repair exonuclease SbcCD ATPase subunit
MKRLVCLLFVVAVCALVSPHTLAQTTAVSDQKFQELVNEVRQLRIEVQRLSTSAQRMQLLLERSRSQQEQVVRLTQQLGNVRDELSAVRDRQSTLKVALEEAEKVHKTGLKSDAEMKAISAELSNLSQFEQRLSDRELQLTSELELERSTLNELKTRLDKLEQEIATPSAEPAKKQN